MKAPESRDSAQDRAIFRAAISLVLAGGVSISAVLIGLGLLSGLVLGWDWSLVGAGPGRRPPTDFSAIADNLSAMRPLGLTQLGLLVLLATPVLRVVTSLIGFAIQRDRQYVVVSLIVLGVLLSSLFVLR